MAKTTIDLYSIDNLSKIMKNAENREKLRHGFYSEEVEGMSKRLKALRTEIKQLPKSQKAEKQLEIAQIKDEMEDKKHSEIEEVSNEIQVGKANLNIAIKQIKGHESFIADNISTFLVSQIIKQELRRSYKLYPSNMDMIIEQLICLLDNPMPKLVIRADVRSFFESIPQETLTTKLAEDGFVSKRSLKYLKRIFYICNDISGNKSKVGVPRGLAFSSYLSELYMKSIDADIKAIDGIYFYKRYVDDIIIVADPFKCKADDYWRVIDELLKEKSLRLHEDSKKKYMTVLDDTTTKADFDYLGYHFLYTKGLLSVGLSEKRYKKLLLLIDAIFEIYSKCSHYRSGKEKPVGNRRMRRDSLHQLLSRIKTITSNGYLSGRKNFVSTGIYYSNKYLTDYSQLQSLDDYLYSKIEDSSCFCPPANLFNYGEGNGYADNMKRIRHYLHQFTFMTGFEERRIYKKGYYSRTLMDLQHIYYSRKS